MAKKDKATLDEYEAGLQREREVAEQNAVEQQKTDTSEHKDYTVMVDGAVINGELLNIGDVVTLHPDDARRHTDADVRLSEVK